MFTVNHDEDNVIKFTPQIKVLFKTMLKKPEREVVKTTDEAMHLEVGIVKSCGNGSINTETNHLIDFKKAGSSKN